jgi:predicted phosphodiesterase
MSTVVKDLGAVSAYAYAVEKGYTGTEAEFAELMADYAEVGQRAEDAADSALESKTAAQTAATTATNKASEATTAAQTATTKAAEAQADADAAALDASQALSAASTATTKATEATTAAATATSAATTATTAKDDAVSAKTAAQTAQTGAETAAASVEASAEQIATNAEDISQLKSEFTALEYDGSITLTSSDFEQGGFSQADGQYESGNRIRLKSAIRVNAETRIQFPQNGLYYYVWLLESDDLDHSSILSGYDWNQYSNITVPYGCYVYIAVSNAKNHYDATTIHPSNFTGNIVVALALRNDKDITALNKKVSNAADGIKPLYLGNFVRAGFSTNAFTQSTQRLCTKDCVALPYGEKTKIKVTMDKASQGTYLFAVRAGRTAQNLSSNKYWYKSGDTVTFDAHEQYYRVIFAHGYLNDAGTNYIYYDIDLDELEKINPVIEYYKDTDQVDTVTANADNLGRLTNAKNVLSASSHGGTTTYPVIFHASDFHGDRERLKNALKYSSHCDADAIVLSGDIVANRPLDGADWMHELFADFSGKPIICTGNHDVDNSSYTDADVYNYYMAPSASKIGNTNGKTYYYTDIPSKSLRIIVTDIYQYGATTRSNAHMSSDQLAYICTALKTAPNGYGILIVTHTPCVDVGNLADANYSTFFQSLRKYGFTHYDITGTPIYDIVDAFNNRTTISKTYAQTGSPSSISVSDDFSGVDASVEFIAHLTGHIHEDSVCYLPSQTKQLMLNICCGVAMTGGSSYPYLADDCDITRLPYDKTQDAINAYVIDRTHKTVKVVRLGGTLTYDMKEREYMAIPYAD